MKHKGLLTITLIVFLITEFTWAKEMEPVDDSMVRIYKTIKGTNEQEMIKQASIESVQQCVSRIYLSEQLIIARSLLEKYIARNYEKFTYSVQPLSKNYVGDDMLLELNVFVRYDVLVNDLKEKRFLYKPRYKPYFGIFIEETLNGQPASDLLTQNEVTNVLIDRAVRLPKVALMYPQSNVDLTSQLDLLEAAMKESQKNSVGLLISGKSDTNLIKKEQLYYDVFYFYETHLHLYLIRSDTGEIIYDKEYKVMTYNTDEQQSIKNSVLLASLNVTNDIINFYYEIWNKIFLNAVDYQIMITGIDDEGLKLIKQKIESLNPETEVYVRSFYKKTAVLNIVTPIKKEELQYNIKDSPYPNFRILEMTGQYLEAQTEH